MEQDEENLFVATYYVAKNIKEAWLVDNGCTNHMAYDESLSKKLDKSYISKVKIGNGKYVDRVKQRWKCGDLHPICEVLSTLAH